VLSDPLSISYDGSAKSLVRNSMSGVRSIYRTADRTFEMTISRNTNGVGHEFAVVEFTRFAPDPTGSDPFDPYRPIGNSFSLGFRRDVSRHEASTVLPLLRSALNSFVDDAMMNRILNGEK